MKTAEAKEFFSRQETKDLLGVSLRTVDYLRKSGELTGFKIRGRVMFKREDIDAFIQKNRDVPQDKTELIPQIGSQLLSVGVAAVAPCYYQDELYRQSKN